MLNFDQKISVTSFFSPIRWAEINCLIRGVGNGRETGNSHTLNGNINHGKVSEGNLA